MALTIPSAVVGAARDYGQAPALIQPGGPRLSYVDLHERVRTVARALIAEGLRPGDRLAIWSPNTHHWVQAALGASYAGAALVPINTRFTGPEALDLLTRSGARGLIVAGRFLGVDRLAALRAAAGGRSGLPRLLIRIPIDDGDGTGDGSGAAGTDDTGDGLVDWSALDERAARVPPALADSRAGAVTPDQVSDILFTSGTTGRSKGAMSAHRQSLAVAAAWARIGGLRTADRYLVINPFFHSFGFKAGILACLVSGAALVPQAVFDTAQTMELVARERITVLPGPPTIYQSLLDHPDRHRHDLSTLRLAVTGAATVPAALIERMRDELAFDTVLTAYGLTEAVVATMCRPGDEPSLVARTCGRAAADFEVRVADESGAPAPPGRSGEVLLRGPNVMLGYLDDPDATAAAIDSDGWLHTGDLGQLDEHGYLTITDRLKDMYICGGFNVYPAEVERTLARLPGVAESAVIGVPDPRLGEVGRAYVVPRPDHPLTAADVLDFCRLRLANYKVPREVEFRGELPRNPSGKVLKYLLREESR